MQRRDFLSNATLIASAGALWASLRAAPSLAGSDPLLDRVCDLVIPDSDTPGALHAGVPSFIALAFARGLGGAAPEDRTRLELLLHEASGADFVSLPPAKQQSVLEAVDAAAYSTSGSVWPHIKTLIVMGYYTSEIGASQELHYQLVPGRFDPDVPVKPGDRASSTDWTGQRF